MQIEGVTIVDMFGNELNPGDEVITFKKDTYLKKIKITKIDRSIQYVTWDKHINDYSNNMKGWSVLFTNGFMLNMYKI